MKLINPINSNKSIIPMELKVSVVSGVRVNGMSGRESMEVNSQELGIELKPSYFKHPHTHISRWTKEFEKGIEKQDDKVIELLRKYELVTE